VSAKISVIVPVYNVEKYLKRSLDCIKEQTFSDFEAILVDDGSTDNGGQICEAYAKSDSRFSVIHKKNGGLSSARNEGLKYAAGEYLAFVDSDDMVSPDFLYRLYSAAISSGADIVVCSEKVFSSEGEITEKAPSGSVEIITPTEYMRDIFKYHSTYIPTWNKLYKREIFNGVLFPVGKLHEDTFTTPLCVERAKKIARIPDELYYYYRNTEGIAHSKFSPRRLDDVEAHLLLFDRVKSMGLTEAVKGGSEWFVNYFIRVTSLKNNEFTDKKAVKKALKAAYKPLRKKLLKEGILRADWRIIIFLSGINIGVLKSHRAFLNFSYKLIKGKK